jgi:hypothetical protein
VTYLLFEHDLFGKPIPTFPDHAPLHASLDSIASRTSSAEVRTPSFWRISEEVLATVLYDALISQAISERLLPVPSRRRISISRDVSRASRLEANDGPAKARL